MIFKFYLKTQLMGLVWKVVSCWWRDYFTSFCSYARKIGAFYFIFGLLPCLGQVVCLTNKGADQTRINFIAEIACVRVRLPAGDGKSALNGIKGKKKIRCQKVDCFPLKNICHLQDYMNPNL